MGPQNNNTAINDLEIYIKLAGGLGASEEAKEQMVRM